jgi:putative ABC transport system substrate-binding protein
VREALQELGYVEGKTILFEAHEKDRAPAELSTMAKELVDKRVDLIVAIGNAASQTAVNTTTNIPIVFQQGDPVRAGLAKSLGKPGGNATGVYVPTPELEAKRLELIKQIIPTARRIGYLRNTANPLAKRSLDEVKRAAAINRLQLIQVNFNGANQLDSALNELVKQKLDAAVISSDPVLSTQAKTICAAARRARLPISVAWEHYHKYGALTSYGPSGIAIARSTALYIDRIIKGARPYELPVEELGAFELRIDMREAAALHLQIPHTVLMRADELMR